MSNEEDRAELLNLFEGQLLEFVKLLRAYLPDDKNLFEIQTALEVRMYSISIIVQSIVKRLEEDEKENQGDNEKKRILSKIEQRDDNFFLDDKCNIFSSIQDKNKVIPFKTLWKNPQFSNESKESIWEWVILLMEMIKSYRALKQ